MFHFLRSSRPGAFADDAIVLSGIRRQMMVVQLINGSDFVWSSTEAARKAVNKLSAVPTGAVSA